MKRYKYLGLLIIALALWNAVSWNAVSWNGFSLVDQCRLKPMKGT